MREVLAQLLLFKKTLIALAVLFIIAIWFLYKGIMRLPPGCKYVQTGSPMLGSVQSHVECDGKIVR